MSRLLKRDSGQSQEIPTAMIEQASKEPEKRLNVKLPQSKHEAFRLACMTNHMTMSDEVEAFIDSYLAKRA